MFALKQTGLVAEFRTQFELLAASVGQLDESTLSDVFVNGLMEHVRAELFLLSPKSLKETMDVAS